MKRLTIKTPYGYKIDMPSEYYSIDVPWKQHRKMRDEKIHEIIDRLAAYEDTGLEPEEIMNLQHWRDMHGGNEGITAALEELEAYRKLGSLAHLIELVEAEKDGRLVVLPCKITDTIYIVESVFKKKKRVKSNVVSAQIDHITIGGSGKPVLDVETESENWYYALEAGEYYMSREEAEAALEGGGSDA